MEEFYKVLEELMNYLRSGKRNKLNAFYSYDRDWIIKKLDSLMLIHRQDVEEARRIVYQRDRIMEKVESEKRAIIERANEEAERITSDSELLKRANEDAVAIIGEAEAERRNLIGRGQMDAANTYLTGLRQSVTQLDKMSALFDEVSTDFKRSFEDVQYIFDMHMNVMTKLTENVDTYKHKLEAHLFACEEDEKDGSFQIENVEEGEENDFSEEVVAHEYQEEYEEEVVPSNDYPEEEFFGDER